MHIGAAIFEKSVFHVFHLLAFLHKVSAAVLERCSAVAVMIDSSYVSVLNKDQSFTTSDSLDAPERGQYGYMLYRVK